MKPEFLFQKLFLFFHWRRSPQAALGLSPLATLFLRFAFGWRAIAPLA
ncbi:MAG: hypothetical protein SAL07_07505 [Oscillatoria sp. PMC 1051.18]|nr:hypothetical protein [Oscillatoria sp. PMC 1050.18]MEC5029742.1 hypothetical protein [Oscillatoria sp. PMC 1051.18]